MKLKSKKTKSLSRVNLPLLFQLIAVITIAMLITCASGCKTGGSWINPNGAGKIIRPSELSKDKPDFQPLPPPPLASLPAEPVESKKVESAKSAPVPSKPIAAKANPVVVNPKSAGKLEPFSPTISAEPAKLPPVKAKLPSRIVEGGCVITTDCGYDPEIAGPCEAAPEEATSPYWGVLSYYILIITGLIVLWMVYYTIKDILHMRKQGTPITDHIKKLKKPVKVTRDE